MLATIPPESTPASTLNSNTGAREPLLQALPRETAAVKSALQQYRTATAGLIGPAMVPELQQKLRVQRSRETDPKKIAELSQRIIELPRMARESRATNDRLARKQFDLLVAPALQDFLTAARPEPMLAKPKKNFSPVMA